MTNVDIIFLKGSNSTPLGCNHDNKVQLKNTIETIQGLYKEAKAKENKLEFKQFDAREAQDNGAHNKKELKMINEGLAEYRSFMNKCLEAAIPLQERLNDTIAKEQNIG